MNKYQVYEEARVNRVNFSEAVIRNAKNVDWLMVAEYTLPVIVDCVGGPILGKLAESSPRIAATAPRMIKRGAKYMKKGSKYLRIAYKVMSAAA